MADWPRHGVVPRRPGRACFRRFRTVIPLARARLTASRSSKNSSNGGGARCLVLPRASPGDARKQVYERRSRSEVSDSSWSAILFHSLQPTGLLSRHGARAISMVRGARLSAGWIRAGGHSEGGATALRTRSVFVTQTLIPERAQSRMGAASRFESHSMTEIAARTKNGAQLRCAWSGGNLAFRSADTRFRIQLALSFDNPSPLYSLTIYKIVGPQVAQGAGDTGGCRIALPPAERVEIPNPVGRRGNGNMPAAWFWGL